MTIEAPVDNGLACESRPIHPIPQGRRPGIEYPVHDDETFESIARKFHVPVDYLILHNFGTLKPREINWYLRVNVGCHKRTHDLKNYRFTNGLKPGKIYIPEVVEMEPEEIVVQRKPNLKPVVNLGHNPTGRQSMLSTDAFKHEFKYPKKEPATAFKYLLWQFKLAFEGGIDRGSFLKSTVKKDQLKLALEGHLTKKLSVAFAGKLGDKLIDNIVAALKKGSIKDVAGAVFGLVEASCKATLMEGEDWEIAFQWGVEGPSDVSKDGSLIFVPFYVRFVGKYGTDVELTRDTTVKLVGKVEGGFNFGLTKEAWAQVYAKVGPPLRQILAQSGRALVETGKWLASEGVLTATVGAAGVAAAVFAMTSLTVWATNRERKSGTLVGLATWYGTAYSAKVFGNPRPTGWLVPEDAVLRDRLQEVGERDAVADAFSFAAWSKPGQMTPTSEQDVLEAFHAKLVADANGNPMDAKSRLERQLTAKAQQKLRQ